ncbi:MAG TPA: TonB family protein, partial [Candidatus Acidoferrales bacterium]|nr:TonB family protein [Candidatus Acidoferrales bacterium]
MPLLKKVPTLGRILRISAAALVIFFCVAVQSHAQQTQIDSLAAKVASAIHKSFKKTSDQQSVMVMISEPVTGPTELGATIANEFRSALAARGISVVSDAKLQQTEDEEKIPALGLRDRGTLACVASDVGAWAVVDGTIRVSGNKFDVTTSVLRVENAKVFSTAHTGFDRTPELAELKDRRVPSPPVRKTPELTTNIPEPGKNGYTIPTCLYCPNPRYSDRAFAAREQGTVVLDVVIAPDGKAHSVSVRQGLSCGLNQQALDTIENVY